MSRPEERTIRVQAPGNRIIHYPADMHPADIEKHLQSLFPVTPEMMSAHKPPKRLIPTAAPEPIPPSTVTGGGMGTVLDFQRDTPNTIMGQLGGIGSILPAAVRGVFGGTDKTYETVDTQKLLPNLNPRPGTPRFITVERYGAMAPPFSGNLFHGTQNVFGEFADEAAHAADSLYGPGHYFTDSPETASEYAMGKRPPRIYMTDEQRAEYFTPGNIVEGYSGKDRVLKYHPAETPSGGWSVEVRGMRRTPTGEWVDDPRELVRRHSTAPYIEPANRPNVRVEGVELKNPFDVEEKADPEVVKKFIEHMTTSEEDIRKYPRFGDRVKIRMQNDKTMIQLMDAKTNNDLYHALANYYESKFDANAVLERMGFDGISYPGGRRIQGAVPHKAYVVFSKSSLRPPGFPAMKPSAPPPSRPPQ